jgi:hypothetical protein
MSNEGTWKVVAATGTPRWTMVIRRNSMGLWRLSGRGGVVYSCDLSFLGLAPVSSLVLHFLSK